MLKSSQLVLVVAVALIVLASVGCGGTGAAPINGGSLAGVAVSVQPATMTITTGTTQPFTATVINTSETGVGWLVNGFPGGVSPLDGSTPFGTIDKNGNYTAPPFIPAPPSVTVTAVANADNSATGNASVSINGTPSPVSISPLTANLEVGGIALFTATVRNSDLPVTWLVENVPGGNDVVGTVSLVPDSPNQVVYAAPLQVPGGNTTAQVHVTAQSVAIPTQSASAVVNLSVLGSTVVTITDPSVPPTVQTGQTQSFQSKVTGTSDATVSWEVDAIPGGNANVGTITTEAKGAAVYTAPAQVPNPPQVIVTAVSNAQPAAQASILVNVIPAIKVTITISADPCTNPGAILINSAGFNSVASFTASVTGTDQEVTWQVNQITGGNSTVGTITQKGVYTAPAQVPNPATVVVSAVSVADPQVIGKESLTITSVPVPIVSISCAAGESCEKASASVSVSDGIDLVATVAGLGNSDVAATWNVNNIPGGGADIGTFDQTSTSGCETTTEYVAPISIPNPPTVTVNAVAIPPQTATSPNFDITITPPPPITLSLMPGNGDPQTVQVQPPNNKILYTATQQKNNVNDVIDPVSWTITSTGQDCSVSSGSICGTITPTGINISQQFTATYTAPATVPPNPNVTVTVTSEVDPSVSDFNQVAITSTGPTIAIIGPSTLQAGGSPVSYTAVITNANPKTITWELGCISDSGGNQIDDFCGGGRAYGPGCIKGSRGEEICDEQPDELPPPIVVYTPPGIVSNAYYLQNACTPNGDPKASIVPINVQMIANGCPLQGGNPICTALACVTVTPP
jgi:hypothetical protein